MCERKNVHTRRNVCVLVCVGGGEGGGGGGELRGTLIKQGMQIHVGMVGIHTHV